MAIGIPNPLRGMSWGTGLIIGAAAVVLAPVILPVATGVLKSLAKAGIKGGMMLYEKGRVLAEEARESLDDLAAEAKAELAEGTESVETKPKKTAVVVKQA